MPYIHRKWTALYSLGQMNRRNRIGWCPVRFIRRSGPSLTVSRIFRPIPPCEEMHVHNVFFCGVRYLVVKVRVQGADMDIIR